MDTRHDALIPSDSEACDRAMVAQLQRFAAAGSVPWGSRSLAQALGVAGEMAVRQAAPGGWRPLCDVEWSDIMARARHLAGAPGAL